MLWGRRTIQASRSDHPRTTQRGLKCDVFGVVQRVCTVDHPGFGAGQSAVLIRDVSDLHMFLCACADSSTKGRGPSAGTKIELDRDCVVFDVCITDYLSV
jgi:hypothetical protein